MTPTMFLNKYTFRPVKISAVFFPKLNKQWLYNFQSKLQDMLQALPQTIAESGSD
jgi:hypothetical protein